MKPLIFILATCILSTGCLSCDTDEPTPHDTETTPSTPGQPGVDEGNGDSSDEETSPQQTDRAILISVGSHSFTATLDDNAAAHAFLSMLPMTVTMTELNGNEKYYSLPQSLPTATYRPGTIHAGDLMLWGSNTVVLFYETFSSGYSYTRLGRVDNPEGLAEAVGRGNVTVTFSVSHHD